MLNLKIRQEEQELARAKRTTILQERELEQAFLEIQYKDQQLKAAHSSDNKKHHHHARMSKLVANPR